MASKKVFDLMEAEDWNEVAELLTNIAWTSQDLEEKHGVRNSIELFLLLIVQMALNNIILLYLKLSVFRGHSHLYYITLYYV